MDVECEESRRNCGEKIEHKMHEVCSAEGWDWQRLCKGWGVVEVLQLAYQETTARVEVLDVNSV